MKTIITEVFYRDVPVGRVISQAVLTRAVGMPFDYRPGYRMVARPNTDDSLARVRHKVGIAHTKMEKHIATLYEQKVVLSPQRRMELEARLRTLEREYVQRVLATIQEFECLGGDKKYGS